MVTRRLLPLPALLVVWLSPTSAAPLYPVPVSPSEVREWDMAGGDFNGDSKVDLVTCSSFPFLMTFLPGAGDGTFGPKSTIPLIAPFLRIRASDLDGDGRLDLVGLRGLSSPDSSSIVAMLGNGDGTFLAGAPTPVSESSYGWGLAVGDLDGDGRRDVVVATQAALFLLRGLGGGSFAAGTQIAAAPGVSVVIGNFNGDGHPDLAVGSGGAVRILLGLGGGAFGPQTVISAGWDNGDIDAADFDNDGDLDLVTSSFSNNPYPWGNLNVLRGDGAGGFSLAGTYGTAGDGAGVRAADLDGDGVGDLATVGRGKLETFQGLGNCLFSPAREYGSGTDAEAVVTADLDGDGTPDLAVAGNAQGVSAFLNDGAGRFGQPRFGSRGGGGRIVAGDFNEDGRPDLAATDRFSNEVVILLADNPGSFEAERRFPASVYANAIAVGEFNGDQHLDLATASQAFYNGITILLGHGDGSFSPGVTLSAGEVHNTVVVGDFNGDGRHDLAAANGGNSNVWIFIGNGDGTFESYGRVECGVNPVDLAVADLDGNGSQDLVVVAAGLDSLYNDQLAILLSHGDGTFAPATFIPLGGQRITVAAGDFNDDSIPDVAVGGGTFDVVASVFLGLGGGQFGPRTDYPGFAVSGLVVGDFDGDQVQDLAGINTARWVFVLRGTGTGAFNPAEAYATAGDFGYGPYDLAAADFNGDRRGDLALAPDTAVATLLLSQGSAAANLPPMADAGTDLSEECSSPAGAGIALDGSLSSDPDSTPGTHDDIVSFEWFENRGTPAEAFLGTGETLAVTLSLGAHAVTLVVTDSGGLTAADDLLVSVVDTTPTDLSVALDPSALWPPNHRMVPVTAAIAAIDACGTASVSLVSVTSDEPDDAPGGSDGTTTNDIQGATTGVQDLEFSLRAERLSGGSGRTYTATYQAVDGAQNVTQRAVTAFVPHDQSGITDPISLQLTETPAGTLLSWSGVPGADSYRAIRGDLELLVSMGQGPPHPAPACLASALSTTDTTGLEDPTLPAPGRAFFYLVEYNDGRSSGFGSQSTFWDRTEALGPNPCP